MELDTRRVDSILECLDYFADTIPYKPACIYLPKGMDNTQEMTYAELVSAAKKYARMLVAHGCRDENVLLIYPTGLDFVVSFFACLYAGATAIPVNLARNPQQFERISKIATDSNAEAIITTFALRSTLQNGFSSFIDINELQWFDESTLSEWDVSLYRAEPTQTAFIQYTSGSTGVPKGVVVSHGNILANQCSIQRACGHKPGLIAGGWLPQFHDMGLIGHMLQPLFLGGTYVFMSPLSFIQRPIRWLQLLSHYHVHSSAAPNFAYEHCVESISDEQLGDVDLSAWKVALNGSEPVKARSMQRFADKFSVCGFDKNAFLPCYGMAETTLFISGGPIGSGFSNITLDSKEFGSNRISFSEKGTDIVSCGKIDKDFTVKIVNPQSSTECLNNEVGEIWIKGSSVAQAYWNKEDISRSVFAARLDTEEDLFLRTGDLGFIYNDDLYITGRIKDMVIIRGRNIYPHDIEHTLTKAHEYTRANCTAVFSVDSDEGEKIIAIQEIKKNSIPTIDCKQLKESLLEVVANEHDVSLDQLYLVKPNTIPKTSSGKVMRFACGNLILKGTIQTIDGCNDVTTR